MDCKELNIFWWKSITFKCCLNTNLSLNGSLSPPLGALASRSSGSPLGTSKPCEFFFMNLYFSKTGPLCFYWHFLITTHNVKGSLVSTQWSTYQYVLWERTIAMVVLCVLQFTMEIVHSTIKYYHLFQRIITVLHSYFFSNTLVYTIYSQNLIYPWFKMITPKYKHT